MAVCIYIPIPSLAVHAVYLAIMFTLLVMVWQLRRVISDRQTELDVRRRAASSLDMRHVAMAPADVLERPGLEIANYRVKPYRRDEEELREAA